jgi:hypothetical protein
MTAYRSKYLNSSGKRPLTFSLKDAINESKVRVPCGGCVGCRLEKSRQWAVRCMHEAQLYENNSFITLTYSEENLPEYGTLVKSDLQKFWKRLRKRFGNNIRYYGCGEYGDKTHRPHYHACVFNWRPDDGQLFKETEHGKIFSSATLDQLWTHGHTSFGEVTFQSAAYVARYCMKKLTGDRAAERYEVLDPHTGEIIELTPEFSVSSRRPGIGAEWLKLYSGDVYPFDEVISNGHPSKPPAYYDRWLEANNPELWEKIKKHRQKQGEKFAHDNTPDRKRVKEIIKMRQLGQLDRSKTEEL